MRRFATLALISLLGVQTMAWGLCPCAIGKALRALASAGAAAKAHRPCCPACRKAAAPEAPADGPACPPSSPNEDCPHCGALARGATSPTVSAPEAPLPSMADVLAWNAVLLWVPVPAWFSEAGVALLGRGPPDARVETVVLRI